MTCDVKVKFEFIAKSKLLLIHEYPTLRAWVGIFLHCEAVAYPELGGFQKSQIYVTGEGRCQ